MRAGKLLLSGFAAAVLSSCASTAPEKPGDYAPHALTREEARRVEADVRRRLQNPDALFSGLKAARSRSGPFVVCGWVNLRDGNPEFVRYVGHRPFAASYADGPADLRDLQALTLAKVKSEAPPLYTYCSRRGMPL